MAAFRGRKPRSISGVRSSTGFEWFLNLAAVSQTCKSISYIGLLFDQELITVLRFSSLLFSSASLPIRQSVLLKKKRNEDESLEVV